MILADPTAPLTRHDALTAWQFVPQVSAALTAAFLLYLFGTWRVRREHPSRPWPLRRTLSFAAALAAIAVATQSSIGAYDDVLFWIHMVQHLLLIMVAPPLLVTGRPVMLLLHAAGNPVHTWTKKAIRSRAVTGLTCPFVAAPVYAAVIVGTHLTSFMNTVLVHPLVHDLEHLLYLAAGYLFFLPVLGSEPIRWRLSYPGKFFLLALAMPVDTFVGVVLTQANHELFPAYAASGRDWGPSLLADLHAGGAVMWVGGDALMLLYILILAVAVLRERSDKVTAGRWLESARLATLAAHASQAGAAAVVSDSATADTDEHLAAYNAYLARLAGREQPVPRDGTG
jgi:cytochrome c oxidase assembly factor CtaG